MLKDALHTTEEYDQVIDSIQKHYYLLEKNNNHYKFNNRLLLSDSPEFLKAVRADIGGELIIDNSIGAFLYFGNSRE